MKFGDDIPEAAGHLNRQLATIDVIENLAAQLRFPPDAASDLAVLVERVGTTPVHLGAGIENYLETSLACLRHLRTILTTGSDVPTVVLLSSLRPVLMASGRVVFILGPDDRDTQFERAMMVLRQECDSFVRALNALSKFQHLASLRPPKDLVSEVKEATSKIQGPRRGEGQVLDEMAQSISAAVASSPRYRGVEGDVVCESVTHAWHTFSGGAHGYVWPDEVPGDFITSFGAVVPVAHWAMDLGVRRTQT